MVAILHSIITDIENSKIQEQLNYWRWQSNIYHNKKDTITQMNLIFTDGVSLSEHGLNRDKIWYIFDIEEIFFLVANYKNCYYCNNENDYNCAFISSDKYKYIAR